MPSERKVPGKPSKWIVYYKDVDGKRNSKSFDTKAKALAFEKTEKANAPASKKPITRGLVTFGDLVLLYVKDGTAGRGGDPWKEQTIANVERRVKSLYAFVPADTLLRNIDKNFLFKVREALQLSDYARSTQTTFWTLLKSILAWGVERDWIDTNPAADLKLRLGSKDKYGEETFEVFTKEEVAKIVSKAIELSTATHGQTRRAYQDTWLLVPLLFETGARINELLALPWTALDFKESTVRIAQNQSRDKRTLQSPKTRAGYRTITISDELMRRLKEFYQRRAGYDFVFMTRTKTRFEYRNMLRWWHNLLEEAGVPEAGFHKARHYYASRLIEAGVDAKVLTGNLGHTDVAFTMNVYGHLFDDRDTRDKKRLVAAQLSTLEAA